MSAMPGQATAKAFLTGSDGKTVTFVFNPTDLTVSKTATWTSKAKRNAEVPAAEFTGTGARSLKTQVVFDTRAANAGPIKTSVDTLFEWTRPHPATTKKGKPQPAQLVLHWGAQQFFPCVLASVSVKYTLFDPEGKPLKAVVDLTLTEVPSTADTAKQNPTSGGLQGRRSRTVVAGESLQSIAYAEYGHATYWRALASTNRVDNPLRLSPGTTLFIPTQDEAEGLA